MTKEETKTLIKSLYTAYPNTKRTDAPMMVETWFSLFAEYDRNVVFAATKMYMRNGKFFPQPVEIRKFITIVNNMNAKTNTVIASERTRIALESHSNTDMITLSDLPSDAFGVYSRDCYDICPYYAIGKCFGDSCRL